MGLPIQTPPICNDVIQIVIEHQLGGKRNYKIVANRQRLAGPTGLALPEPIVEGIDPIMLAILLAEAQQVHLQNFLKMAQQAMAGAAPEVRHDG